MIEQQIAQAIKSNIIKSHGREKLEADRKSGRFDYLIFKAGGCDPAKTPAAALRMFALAKAKAKARFISEIDDAWAELVSLGDFAANLLMEETVRVLALENMEAAGAKDLAWYSGYDRENEIV